MMVLYWIGISYALIGAVTGAQDCSYPTGLLGFECPGLHASGATTAASCEQACCQKGTACSAWNFCNGTGPGSKGCGTAEHGGCYLGHPDASCYRSNGWMGGLAQPCNSSSFPTSLQGLECTGLTKAVNTSASASSEACQAACCSIGLSCNKWQFCANAKFCGSPSAGGGCWLDLTGDATCTTVQDGWQGASRTSKPPPPPPAPPQTATIDLSKVGLAHDGIGGITSNGECRLLYDYPEPQRSDILDYLFLPSFGLSSQVLKVEIGSDAQSTVGTEPSYQHSRGLISYSRGIQYWFLVEAKKRNPDLKIAALEWSAPGWIGNGSFFTQDNVDYILGWLHGATDLNNITVDYLGIWNEPPIKSIPTDWLLSLRSQLNAKGHNNIVIMAPDAGATQSVTTRLLADMVNNASVREAVGVIGTHGFWGSPPANFKTIQKSSGTRAWVSESWHHMGTWKGATAMADGIISSHLGGDYTGWTAWGLIFAAYSNVICQDKGLMYTTNPWGAGYQVQPTIWTTAHFTQFTRVGWKYLLANSGSGSLQGGVNYVSLVSPDGKDFSVIIDAFALSSPLNLTFTVQGATLTERQLQVWTSNETAQFVQQSSVMVTVPGKIVVQLEPATLYSFSTLPQGAIRRGEHDHSSLDTLFPLPHTDDFESLDVGRSPKYFTDWDGSFSVEGETDRGEDSPVAHGEHKVLRQLTEQRPIRWHCTDVDPLTIFGEGIQNYAISTLARIENTSVPSYSQPYVAVYARVTRPYSHWCPSYSGYRFRVGPRGNWTLEALANKTLASGTIPQFNGSAWVNLTLSCNRTIISASLDGKLLASVNDLAYDSGSAGLGSGFHMASFDAMSLIPLRPTPSQPVHHNSQEQAAYCSFTNVQRQRSDGWYGLAFQSKTSQSLTRVARFAAAGSNDTHTIRLYSIPNGTTSPSVVAETAVNMASGLVDSAGFVFQVLSKPAALVPNTVYYLVSQEKASGDYFYGLADTQPCIGSPGPGGTLPRLKMLTESVEILGGVESADGVTWHLLDDWEPRSYGPLTFVVSS